MKETVTITIAGSETSGKRTLAQLFKVACRDNGVEVNVVESDKVIEPMTFTQIQGNLQALQDDIVVNVEIKNLKKE